MDSLIPRQNPEDRIRPPPSRGQALLYESGPVRRFAGLKLSGPLPGETTILTFRHLLERHSLGQGLPEKINAHLESRGLKLREGTIVDGTIIEAPPSTRNRAGERDPEMHQTKKGNQWRLGMKVHMGVDSETGIVHSMSTTSANVHGVTEAHHLLHGGETVAWGDAGCQGVGKGGRTWGWRWNGGRRCVRGGGGSWTRGAGRRWRRRRRHR